MNTTQAATILELDLISNEDNQEEVELPKQLIKDYQDLNEKLDQVLFKIKQRNQKIKQKPSF